MIGMLITPPRLPPVLSTPPAAIVSARATDIVATQRQVTGGHSNTVTSKYWPIRDRFSAWKPPVSPKNPLPHATGSRPISILGPSRTSHSIRLERMFAIGTTLRTTGRQTRRSVVVSPC